MHTLLILEIKVILAMVKNECAFGGTRTSAVKNAMV